MLGDGRGAGSIPGITAQLFLVGTGGALKPLYPTTTFRNTSEAAMYFVNVIDPFVVDGVLPGQSATFRLRVYQGPSYEAAFGSGCFFQMESNDVTVRLGGTLANGEVIPAPFLNGLQGFSYTAVLPPPQYILFNSVSIEGDQLRFTVEENFEVGMGCWENYVVEGSPDLKVWSAPLLTNPPSSFSVPYNPATDGNRFFRFRTVP